MADSAINGAAAVPRCGQNSNVEGIVGELRRLVAAQGRKIQFLEGRLVALEKSNRNNSSGGNSGNHGSNGGNSSCGADIFVDAMEEFLIEFRQRLRNKGDGETRLTEETVERRATHSFGGKNGGERDFVGPVGGGEAENELLFEEGEEAEEKAAKKDSFRSVGDDSADGPHEKDSSRLEDANATLLRCISILNDKDASMNSRTQMASTLSDVIMPLNESAQRKRRSEASDIVPMAGSGKRRLWLETNQRKSARAAIMQPGEKKRKATTKEELIVGFIKERNQNATKCGPKGVIAPKTRPKRATEVAPSKTADVDLEIDVHVPPPAYGRHYTKIEACKIISTNSKKGTATRAAVMKKMVGLGWVPISVRNLSALLRKYENDEVVLDTPWSGRVGGRPRAIRPSNLCNFPHGGDLDMDANIPPPANGSEYTKTEACEIISANSNKKTEHRGAMMKRMIELGWVPHSLRSLQSLLRKYESDEVVLDTPWS